jgi:hypothetical protein
MPVFGVRLINPESQLTHSTYRVEADSPAEAVTRAVDRGQQEWSGTEVDRLSSYIASVTDEYGQGVGGFEKQLSIAQIQAQLTSLKKQLEFLGESATVSVEAPEPANPLHAQPSIYTPPQGEGPAPTEVHPSEAPGTNRGAFTQADIDRQIAEQSGSAQ